MAKFETTVTTHLKAQVDSYNVASILEKQMHDMLGGEDCFIRDGIIFDRDNRMNWEGEVRKASEEEIKLYESFLTLIPYFRNLK